MGSQENFPVNSERYVPYRNFKFQVRWDGEVVAGISKVSALQRKTEAATWREGGDPSTHHSAPTVWEFEPITLERGVTHNKDFERWANLIYSVDGDAEVSLKNFRKNLFIDLLNGQGQVVKSYKIYRAWVSEYHALPELDASSNEYAIETLVLEHEGWERDTDLELKDED